MKRLGLFEIVGIVCVILLSIAGFVVDANGQEPTIRQSLIVQPIPVHDCDTCDCGGLLDSGPLEMAAGRVITVYIGPGTLNSTTDAKTVRQLLLNGVDEFDIVCGLEFEIVDKPNGARIRVEFVEDLNVLGRAWSGGRIQLNSTRFLGDLSKRRVAQALICHEMGHVLGLVHGGDRNDIMHPHLGNHWSVKEIQTLQRKHDKPSTPWHPTDRVSMGDKLRAAVKSYESANAAWRKRADARNRFAELGRWEDVRRVNPDVLSLLKLRDERGRLVAQYHREWWAINKKWNTSGVDGLIKVGQ